MQPSFIEDKMEKFEAYWEEYGKPHPSSNEYLRITRSFWYMEGYKDAGKDLFGDKDE